MDGKHVRIRKPPHSNSLFFNYKRHFSTSLFAICDHRYRLTYVDIGSYGTQADGGIYNSSQFKQQLDAGQLHIPGMNELPNTNVRLPHFFVADAAFGLSTTLMKPFGGQNLPRDKRIYNVRYVF